MHAVVRTYPGHGARALFDMLEERKAEVEIPGVDQGAKQGNGALRRRGVDAEDHLAPDQRPVRAPPAGPRSLPGYSGAAGSRCRA